MTTRRDFIKKTTVGSAAITLGTFAMPGTLNASVLGPMINYRLLL